jgi:hypothetical protein
MAFSSADYEAAKPRAGTDGVVAVVTDQGAPTSNALGVEGLTSSQASGRKGFTPLP